MGINDAAKSIESLSRKLKFDKKSNGEVKILGSGTFGFVIAGQYTESGKRPVTVAVKVSKTDVFKGYPKSMAADMLNSEGQVIKSLSHVNIVRMVENGIGKIENPSSGSLRSYVILERANKGSLFDCLYNEGRLPAPHISVMKDIASGLTYLHSRSVYHLDLKPENVLVHVGSTGTVVMKIADFGLATSERKAKYAVGTKIYNSPESAHSDQAPFDSAKQDTFAFGVTCYEIVVGDLPWEEKEHDKAMFCAKQSWKTKQCGTTLPKLLEHLFVAPESRISASQCLQIISSAAGGKQVPQHTTTYKPRGPTFAQPAPAFNSKTQNTRQAANGHGGGCGCR